MLVSKVDFPTEGKPAGTQGRYREGSQRSPSEQSVVHPLSSEKHGSTSLTLTYKPNSCIACFGDIKSLPRATPSSFGGNQLSPQLSQPGLHHPKVGLCGLVPLSAGHLGGQRSRSGLGEIYQLVWIPFIKNGLTSASISAIFSSIVGMALLGQLVRSSLQELSQISK